MASDKNSILSVLPSTQVDGPQAGMPFLGVERYAEFSDLILKQTEAFLRDTASRNDALLDGAAGRAVESLVDRETRTRHGIFFSGHALAGKVASCLRDQIDAGYAVYDPTCGAGDLLIQAAKLMPIGASVHDTLQDWGTRLYGTDLHEVFVETAKRRLVLLALYRHESGLESDSLFLDWGEYFPGIRTGDFLSAARSSRRPCCYLMNPPFVSEVAPSWVTWSSGRIQMAGAFLELAIKNARPGEQISAILPDVLRSGTRYGRWRAAIAAQAEIHQVELHGRFDPATDVDVFVLHLTKCEGAKRERAEWPATRCAVTSEGVSLSDLATVTVGAVVPHRHKNRGPWRSYLDVNNAPAFGETDVRLKRRFPGTVVMPPFVVVRRTSNPSDRDRLITTVISGKEPVAVENHLIVIKPHVISLAECRRIARALVDPVTRRWIDVTIRCRHLTTTALKKMPIPTGKV
ncbi:type I restriction-modification system subunit M [Burkholderia vietnamiensis]|uniref:type I restriction-modification system subunit M n=1 Tax=Burkholderia TaxID=32008 RepID=UPI000ADB945F|nr:MULTISPECIES: type I restriction-modification system subunit M [Burkholderia]MBR7912042.1 hypothetical protein [Burkholderia vietnamiensis]MBR8001698.1 hypothetical protein [Burkholderia vietnamiensis]MCA7947220.1 type I restriction-modification system subunit M [Burkholderia vietnamiensis]MCA8211853.1 type I restriction-modification system subunit M [Burkholderia vietnamiensis]MCA8451184.1 type I restriction-modification system subunit M [Burkholderia vietnamiensis]